MLPHLRWLAALAAVLTVSCSTTPTSETCTTSSDCPEGQNCVGGACKVRSDAGAGDDGGTDIEWPDAGPAGRDAGSDPFDPNNPNKDTDCDGLSDAVEFSTKYAGGAQTDPDRADTDGDGLLDGVEAGKTSTVAPATCPSFTGDRDPASTTSPVLADSDCDGLKDGEEDRNHDGKVDPAESDPNNPDGDGDGLKDGLESGVATNPDPARCPAFAADLDPASKTDPLKRDTDGDGLSDGAEDKNKNGKVDPGAYNAGGETDPNKADSDGDNCVDGAEDKNRNGTLDSGESDPLKAGDCTSGVSDTDCDGIADATEGQLGTDPAKADSDGDGLKDGLELGVVKAPAPAACPGFVADADPAGRTNPLSADSDCDGLKDGDEDKNKNGRVDTGETDPANPDTDGDGLLDGLEAGVVTNPAPAACPGFVADADPTTTTDPTKADSDGDGIPDGTEDGNQNGKVDPGELNPKNGSDATPTDIAACSAANLREVQLLTRAGQKADLAFAVAPGFTATTTLTQASEARGAMAFDSARQLAGFALKLGTAPAGADVNVQLTNVENALSAAGALTSRFAQPFTTWDGFPAIRAQYRFAPTSATRKVGEAANDLVSALAGGTTGLLTTLGTETGPFRLKLELVRRSGASVMVVGALSQEAAVDAAAGEQRLFALDDLTNGSALGQFGDRVGAQCDRSQVAADQAIDFLWVVDNSNSMGNKQLAVKNGAQAMADQLRASTLDWRVAVLSSDADRIQSTVSAWDARTYPAASAPRYCPFTRSITDFQTCMSKVGVAGRGSERFFRPVACLLGKGSPATPYANNCGVTETCPACNEWGYTYSTPPGTYPLLTRSATEDPKKLRQDAFLAIVFLTDTNEQSDENEFDAYDSSTIEPPGSLDRIPAWVSFFQNFDGAGLPQSKAFVAGLVCPPFKRTSGSFNSCGDGGMNTRWREFFGRSSGVYADIPLDTDADQEARIQAAIKLIVDTAIGQVSPYHLSKAPISSTLKVATEAQLVGSCNANDIPRSRVNGFDYDGATRTLKFYGNCRPKAGQAGKRIAVSYRYWTDRGTNPDGTTPPCGGRCVAPQVCDPATDLCECPTDCGSASPGPGYICDSASCKWICSPDCNGQCGTNYMCGSACSCVCNPQMSCGPGYKPDLGACTCVCDTAALGCTGTYEPNPTTCACVCKANCGGCLAGQSCNLAACRCEDGPG